MYFFAFNLEKFTRDRIFYTGSARGARDKYEVWAPLSIRWAHTERMTGLFWGRIEQTSKPNAPHSVYKRIFDNIVDVNQHPHRVNWRQKTNIESVKLQAEVLQEWVTKCGTTREAVTTSVTAIYMLMSKTRVLLTSTITTSTITTTTTTVWPKV